MFACGAQELMQQLKRKERDFREAQSELVKVKGALQQERERGVFLLDQVTQLRRDHPHAQSLLHDHFCFRANLFHLPFWLSERLMFGTE